MKFTMNKVTMSCVAVLSGAILFGINGGTIVHADSGTGSQVSTSAAQQSADDETPIDSGTADDSFDNPIQISWAVYAINGDKNNLQLRLGNDASTENAGSSTGTSSLGWSTYLEDISSVEIVGNINTSTRLQSLFASMPNLQIISGLNLLQTSKTTNLSNMFNGDSKLKTVDLSGLDTSSVTDFTSMFDGDSSLTTLDLSKIDMSKASVTTNMLNGTGLSSLTLGTNSVINQAAMAADPYTYTEDGSTFYTANGWVNVNDNTKFLSTKDLMSTYAPQSDTRTQTTWVPKDSVKNINYHIQYVDSATGAVLPVKSDQVFSGLQSDTVNLSEYTLSKIGQLQAGYLSGLNSIENATSGTIEDDGNGGYVVKAKVLKADPVKVTVTQTVGTDKPTDDSFYIKKNDINYKYTDITEPSNGTIDLTKSTIQIGDGEVTSFADYSSATDLNSILTAAIDSQLDSNKVIGDNANTNLITVNAVYTKKNTGGNNNNNTGTTNNVTQKVATTTKTVNLYNQKGKLITDRVLDKDSGWFSDQTHTLDGTLYYRVATDEYVKASDVYVYTAQDNIVRVNSAIAELVDSKGNTVTDRALSPSSEWFTDRYTVINGQKYYRVATNEFVSADKVSLL
ncbi:BspA family leucine-rich repeat surface protein [Companilactobacillus huachuanensis]|uniref:BspA family leucine-rich repeat surface protein n=1 Tax=Companilactobacillus huachuanensis TaxID=2559914 RepID=A0ABW1RM05_9LACO|nr:BspA family leucine-rich repeat surface protein [Companilactobacillus huachuanensis]